MAVAARSPMRSHHLPTRTRLAAANDHRVPRGVLLVALAAALPATALSWFAGTLTLYGDARAHLNVARHVTDGLTPGLAQLGSVWLPLPHLLLSPLVAVTALWHSAIAGAIVGGVCFVYSAVRLFSLAEEWLGSRRCAWVALLLYVTNLNLLYVQGTALTEPVLLAFFMGTAYHLGRWTRTLSHRDLVSAAVLTTAATLTRYDGWFLLAIGFMVVLVWSTIRERRRDGIEANVVIFAVVGSFGIVLWVLYNLIIFHDPLFFIHSNYSAQSQQNALQQVGALSTRGSLRESALTYGWAVVDVAGGALTALGLAGMVDMSVRRTEHRPRDIAILCLLAAPIVFNIIALWGGQSTLRVPERAPFGMWNVRYGLMALPLLALGAASLARDARLGPRTILAIAGSGLLVGGTTAPIVLADGRTGTSSAAAGRPELAARYLTAHYAGGGILADEGSSAPLIFASELDLSDFVTIGYHPYYENAMASPAGNVEWIVMYDGDAVMENVHAHPARFASYTEVLRDGRAHILHHSG